MAGNALFNCEGYRLSRRGFLKATAILSFAALPELVRAQTGGDTRLLAILLRGGLDGIHAMPPVGDKLLTSLRRNINPDHTLKLDSFFALHPAFKTVHEMYQKGEALLVHGTSIPYQRRSHFEGQDVMESGVMTPYASKSGWMGRALDLIADDSIALALQLPLILRGERRPANIYPSWLEAVPKNVYQEIPPLWMSDSALAPFGQQIDAEIKTGNIPFPRLPNEDLSLTYLAQKAARQLSRADGPRMAVLDHVGFDTHATEVDQSLQRFREVDDAIAKFRKSLSEDVWKKTLIVTVTEFGRTAQENGTLGTDHGYGTATFVLGGRLKKSGIVADWPGLKKKDLFEGRDLLATIDTRALYGALISNVLQIDPDEVRRSVIDHTPTDAFSAYL
jgi:uncharacterized protein (DUF1501 family)